MRNGLLGSIAALAASAGLAFAQSPSPPVEGSAGARPGALPGIALAQSGLPEPVPAGPSTLGLPTYPSAPIGFLADPQMPPEGGDEPRLDTERAFAQFDFLLWFIRSMPPSYPLVSVSTTGPLGALNGPAANVLFGAQNFNFNPIAGGRYTLDYWSRRDSRIGFEWVGTVLERRGQSFLGGFGDQVVARPIIDANTGVPGSLLVARPGFARGGVTVDAHSRYWGFEANTKLKLWADATKEISFISGFRYIDLMERINITQTSVFFQGVSQFFYGINFASPNQLTVSDTFQTRNQYYLSTIGLQAKYRFRRWSAQWTSKFSYGPNHETQVIMGNSSLIPTAGAAANTVPGGLLALSTNIGKRHGDPWMVMPEGSFQIGYRLLPSTDLVLGYQFQYLSVAARPGDQINAAINPVYVPTSASYGTPAGVFSPAPGIRNSDFWVQGLNWGLHVHY